MEEKESAQKEEIRPWLRFAMKIIVVPLLILGPLMVLSEVPWAQVWGGFCQWVDVQPFFLQVAVGVEMALVAGYLASVVVALLTGFFLRPS